MPMPEEFARFSACSEIPLKVRTATMAKMATHILPVEDAVKVIEGNGKGLCGWIIQIKRNEADSHQPYPSHHLGRTSELEMQYV
jgi:hypothetical protein